MARVRVLQNADGTLRIIIPAPKARRADETEEAFFARACAETIAKNPSLQGLPAVDLDDGELPQERPRRRHAWRLSFGRIVVDPAAPEPPHPQQALLDEIATATTVSALRAALAKTVTGR